MPAVAPVTRAVLTRPSLANAAGPHPGAGWGPAGQACGVRRPAQAGTVVRLLVRRVPGDALVERRALGGGVPTQAAHRDGDRGAPDGEERDVDRGPRRAVDLEGRHQGAGVGDDDDAADQRAEEPAGDVAHQVGRDRCGDDTADEQAGHRREVDRLAADADDEAEARGDGDEELAGVDGADHLARDHPAAGDQGRRGHRAPAAATGRVDEAGEEAERGEEALLRRGVQAQRRQPGR